ncbi:MAG: hypothetical protein AB8G96_16240 [Phycisphaerales bacterium]
MSAGSAWMMMRSPGDPVTEDFGEPRTFGGQVAVASAEFSKRTVDRNDLTIHPSMVSRPVLRERSEAPDWMLDRFAPMDERSFRSLQIDGLARLNASVVRAGWPWRTLEFVGVRPQPVVSEQSRREYLDSVGGVPCGRAFGMEWAIGVRWLGAATSILAWTVGLQLLWVALGSAWKLQRRMRGRCGRCGYRHSSSSERCSECGSSSA